MLHLAFIGFSGKLPTSEYALMENKSKLGFLQIRHRPSHAPSVPEHMTSHIYYEIDAPFRGKGYGKKILQLGLLEARKIGLKEVFITCDDDNLASKKIIEANGGQFVEEAELIGKSKKMLKYKILLS